MIDPRELALRMERTGESIDASDEAMRGYAAAQVFASGHVLNLRRWTATTLAAPYTSLWHRGPDGRWTFHQDAPPQQACPRYFGASIAASHQTTVELDWQGPRELTVRAGDIEWTMQLDRTPATRTLNGLTRITPDAMFRRPWFLRRVESLIPMLGLGHISLVGTAPNGQAFRVTGQDVWKVVGGRATVGGVDVGPPGLLDQQPRLGDYWVPRDVFAASEAHFATFDPTAHRMAVGNGGGSKGSS